MLFKLTGKMKTFYAILLSAAAAIVSETAFSQERIPDDPQLVTGRLDNGMTYYIRHNSNPEGCADFYIIHNVGALQEEDNQNGLAHFLEHMAFNGTRHYPDKELLDFLAKDGVRFGYNVNAYTSKTETVYNISSVPLVRESFVDSVLMVLHDWSCDISCEPAALDAERGVISEEWRRRDEPRSRMMYKQNDLIYKGAKHTTRNVLGTLEVINGFKPEEILDFYHRWYRPDLQAVVVVGDFDAEKMEQKVRKMFSDIPARENPEPKGEYPVPALEEPLFENMLDPQVKYHVLKVIHRQPFPEASLRNTDFFYKDMFSRQIVTSILDERMGKDAKKQGSPLSSAVLVTSPYGADFYISLFTMSLKGADKMEDALAFYTEEVERMLRYGFSEDEFEAARFRVMKRHRLNMENFASDVTNKQIVDACKENFLRGYAAAFPYDLKELQKLILSELTYEDVQGYEKKMFGDSEKIYSWCMNEKEAPSIPSPERMEEIIALTKAKDIMPEYIEYGKITFDYEPQPGTVVKTRAIQGTDSEEWTLSNGIRVYWTPSGPVKSNTHLSMELYFDTGYRALPQDSIVPAIFSARYIFRNLGIGGHDATALRNSPECAGVNISPYIGQKSSVISMTADRKSIDEGFKMVYGMITDPCFSSEATLKKTIQDNLRALGKKKSNSDIFSEESRKIKYGSHPWMEEYDSASVNAVDMDMVKDVFERSFKDISKLKVFISSDMDKQEIEDLVCRYIASLKNLQPVTLSRTELPSPAYKGETVLDRSYQVETVPKSDVTYSFKGKMKLSPKNLAIVEMMDYIMSARYMQQIREERGGTYHVSFLTEIDYSDSGAFESVVAFQTRPELVDVLVQDVRDEMDRMGKEGPSAKEMEEAAKYLVKHHGEKKAMKANSLESVNDGCINFILYGIEPDYDYDAVIGSISADDIRKFAAKLDKGDKFITIYREE